MSWLERPKALGKKMREQAVRRIGVRVRVLELTPFAGMVDELASCRLHEGVVRDFDPATMITGVEMLTGPARGIMIDIDVYQLAPIAETTVDAFCTPCGGFRKHKLGCPTTGTS